MNTKYRTRMSVIAISIERSGDDPSGFMEGILTEIFDPEPAIGGFNASHLPSRNVTILQPRIP
jgi:hypothetical protein